MRVQKEDADGDLMFGSGQSDFWNNQPEGVGQLVADRLGLFSGEWFLDTVEGMPWGGLPLNDLVVAQGKVLGKTTQVQRDAAIQMRVIQTDGVLSINNYNSQVDPNTRKFHASMILNTIYGGVALTADETEVDGRFIIGVTPLGGGAVLG